MAVGGSQRRQFQDVWAQIIPFTATVDFADAADAETQAVDVTVTGAALGDFVEVAPLLDVEDLTLDARVTAANTVTLTVNNNTGGAVNLASQTVRGIVKQPSNLIKTA